ncbi:hypothetical protein HYH03_014446 [Edaphochlamys debaryana]|uniref:Uncharacterized protein n=1 Tax=Edaphochlamys debaryana TaxID=47281 RepID=A0A835XW85_9CHLO|nr:hypothetical protein HYH03_014446 [Edaphochlamys debaryana]|eukprot:KAG2486949.1 hypothetical protein HYH03_014446 [Edaphochlamys debaryana]
MAHKSDKRSGGFAPSPRLLRRLAETSVSAAQTGLQELLLVADRLGDTLGRQAVPGGGFVVAGDNGVFVSAGALAAAPPGGSTSLSLSAGPGAVASAGGTSSGHRRRRLLAVATDATADLTLSASAAASATGWGLDLTYSTSGQAALNTALAGLIPSGGRLLEGLAALTWNAGSGASATPPALDGTSSYITLRLPAPGYSADRPTGCLQYDATAGTLTGSQGRDSTPSPPRPPPAPPAPVPRAVVLTMSFRMNVSQLATSADILEFRLVLQAAIANALQIPTSAVDLTSVDTTSLSNGVAAVVQLVLPPVSPGTDSLVAELQAKPMETLSPSFINTYGVTAAVVEAGAVSPRPFTEAGTSPALSPTPTSTPSPAPAPSGGDDDKGIPEGAIVGAVWGGMVFLVLLTAIWAVWYTRRHQPRLNFICQPGPYHPEE